MLCSCNPEKTDNKTKTYEITNDHDAPFKYEKEYEKYDVNKYQWKVVITDSTKAEYPFEVYQIWYYAYQPNDKNKLNLLFTDLVYV